MTLESIVIVLLIGAAAGWLGSIIFSGSGLGTLGNIVVGILGGFVGHWLLRELKVNIGGGWLINSIITGAIGAIVILFLVSLVSRKK